MRVTRQPADTVGAAACGGDGGCAAGGRSPSLRVHALASAMVEEEIITAERRNRPDTSSRLISPLLSRRQPPDDGALCATRCAGRVNGVCPCPQRRFVAFGHRFVTICKIAPAMLAKRHRRCMRNRQMTGPMQDHSRSRGRSPISAGWLGDLLARRALRSSWPRTPSRWMLCLRGAGPISWCSI